MNYNNLYIDFFAGSINGFSQVLVGHPLDTYKTYLQTKGKFNISYKHLYRGVRYPLITNIPIISIQFGIESFIHSHFNTYNRYITGALCGIICIPIISVTELYKIQTQRFINFKNTPLSKGLFLTTCRDIPSFSIYFGTYNSCSNYLKKNNSIHYSLISFISGSLAGGFSWFFTYPIDVIKTRIQSNQFHTIHSAYSYGQLLKGIGICSFRGCLVNGTGFFVYEFIRKYLHTEI